MNQVYKTIKNPFTNTMVAASELSKGQGKTANRQISKQQHARHIAPHLISAGVILTMVVLGNSAFAQTVIYNGNPSQLEQAR